MEAFTYYNYTIDPPILKAEGEKEKRRVEWRDPKIHRNKRKDRIFFLPSELADTSNTLSVCTHLRMVPLPLPYLLHTHAENGEKTIKYAHKRGNFPAWQK